MICACGKEHTARGDAALLERLVSDTEPRLSSEYDLREHQ
jgi:hypothetical protein